MKKKWNERIWGLVVIFSIWFHFPYTLTVTTTPPQYPPQLRVRWLGTKLQGQTPPCPMYVGVGRLRVKPLPWSMEEQKSKSQLDSVTFQLNYQQDYLSTIPREIWEDQELRWVFPDSETAWKETVSVGLCVVLERPYRDLRWKEDTHVICVFISTGTFPRNSPDCLCGSLYLRIAKQIWLRREEVA